MDSKVKVTEDIFKKCILIDMDVVGGSADLDKMRSKDRIGQGHARLDQMRSSRRGIHDGSSSSCLYLTL